MVNGSSHQRLPHPRRAARGRRDHDDRGPWHAREPAPHAGGLPHARRLPVRLLHAGQICSAVGVLEEVKAASEPRHRRPHQLDGAGPTRRCASAHERQYLPLRRLFQHRGRDGRSRREARMKSFTFERATTRPLRPPSRGRPARRQVHRGGTNLLDLMKLEIEARATSSTSTGWVSDRSSRPRTAACASARWCATRHGRRRARAPRLRRADARARWWPAPRASCATRRRRPATSSSAPLLPLFLRHKHGLQQTQAGVRLRRAGRLFAPPRVVGVRTAASPPTRPT